EEHALLGDVVDDAPRRARHVDDNALFRRPAHERGHQPVTRLHGRHGLVGGRRLLRDASESGNVLAHGVRGHSATASSAAGMPRSLRYWANAARETRMVPRPVPIL